jgi:hypothetical protein
MAAAGIVAASAFGRAGAVDPRPLLIAMAAVVAVVPLRRLVAVLPIDDSRVPRLAGRRDASGSAVPAPGALATWVGRVNGGTTSARAATLRLVPGLREIARVRLADRRGISLDHAPVAAAEALGPVAWSVLRPDAPRVVESSMPGMRVDVVDEVVTRLEQL